MSNTVTQDGTGVKQFSLSNVKVPTREELSQKPPMKVIDISEPKTKGTFAERRREIRSNVNSVISKPYLNTDTGAMIFLTEKSYTYTFNNLGEIQLNAAEHLPELIENAILIHSELPTHGSEYATGVYTFFAAAKADEIKPVKLKVKEYSYVGQDLPKNIKAYFDSLPRDYAAAYDTVVLEVDEIEKSPSGSAKDMNQEDSFLSPGELYISVSDLLDLVKGDATKYIPQKRLSIPDDIGPVGPFATPASEMRFEDLGLVNPAISKSAAYDGSIGSMPGATAANNDLGPMRNDALANAEDKESTVDEGDGQTSNAPITRKALHQNIVQGIKDVSALFHILDSFSVVCPGISVLFMPLGTHFSQEEGIK